MSRRSNAASRSRRSRFPWPPIAAEIARVELRRMWRRFRGNEYFLIGGAILAIPIGLGLLVAFAVAHDAGESLAAGDASALDGVVLLLAAGWVATIGFQLFTGVGQGGDVDQAPGMLTARPPKDVAGGLLLTWTIYFGGYVLVPVLVAFAGISLAVGSLAPLLGGVLAAVCIAASATAVGYPIGVALKGVLRRTAALERLKPVLAAIVGVAYFYVMFSGRWVEIVQAGEPVLTGPPLGWIGDLALATTPGADPSLLGVGGALALTIVSVPIGTLATVRAADYTWSADQAHADESGERGAERADDVAERVGGAATGETERRIGSPVATVLDVLCRRPQTRGVAGVTLVRAYRRPMLMVYSLWPLLLAIPLVDQLVQGGTLPWYAPWFAVLIGAYVAGETIPLNALGNQGATLPTLLTSRADGRAVVHGHLVAVALPVVPFAVALAAAAGLLAGESPAEVVVLGGASALAVVAGATLALGFGALFPRFETLTVGDSTEITIPSKRAFGAFSTSISLTTTGLLLAVDETARIVFSALLTEHVPLVSPSPELLHGIGLGLVGLAAIALPAAYVVAVRRIDGFRMD